MMWNTDNKNHKAMTPDGALAALLGTHNLLGQTMLPKSAWLLVINSSDFKVRFAEMTLLSIGSCQPCSPQVISRESSEEEKMTSSAGLGWAPGTQGAPTSGQRCRETAVPRSSSSAQHSLQVTGGEERKGRELIGYVWFEQVLSSLQEHCSQPLTR